MLLLVLILDSTAWAVDIDEDEYPSKASQPAKSKQDEAQAEIDRLKKELESVKHILSGAEAATEPKQKMRKIEMVSLPSGLLIGKYEVTQGQWYAVMGNNPSKFKDCGDNCPVENVSYTDIQKFI